MCADMAQGRSVFKANGSRSALCRSPRRGAATGGCPRRRDRGRARVLSSAGFPRQAARRRASGPAARRRRFRCECAVADPHVASGTARSRTGAVTTSKPTVAHSRPISAPVSQAARRRPPGWRANSASAAQEDGHQCGDRRRATRPPSGPPSARRQAVGRVAATR